MERKTFGKPLSLLKACIPIRLKFPWTGIDSNWLLFPCKYVITSTNSYLVKSRSGLQMFFRRCSHLSSGQGLESPSFFWGVIRQKSLLRSSNSLSEGGTTRMQPMCSLSPNWLRININLTSAWRVIAPYTNSEDVLFLCKAYANETRLPQSYTSRPRPSALTHVLIALGIGMLKYGYCIYSMSDTLDPSRSPDLEPVGSVGVIASLHKVPDGYQVVSRQAF